MASVVIPAGTRSRRPLGIGDVTFALWGILVNLVISVGGSVTLIAISAGVERRIGGLVANPLVRQTKILNVDEIESILHALTTAVLLITLVNLVFTMLVLGQMVMRARRKEIAVRKADCAVAQALIREFMLSTLLLAVAGALFGEACGLTTAWALNRWTPLPTEIGPMAQWLVWPIAITATLIATYLPARVAAKESPWVYFSDLG